MTTPTQPAVLLAHVEVLRDLMATVHMIPSPFDHDRARKALDAAIESLAAHRGEVDPVDADNAKAADCAALAMIGKGYAWDGNRWYLAAHPPQAQAGAGDGVSLIAAERQRHMAVEGWTPEHDDEHGDGALAVAAACYAAPVSSSSDDYSFTHPRDAILPLWPWAPGWWKPSPDNRIRELVKAGALIAAEIDRLKRAALEAKP